ncbi:hypothetical protein FQN50_009142, partial [Emmonsiellopsis sp. PD_5]
MEHHSHTETHGYEGILENYLHDSLESLFFDTGAIIDTGAAIDSFSLSPGFLENLPTDGPQCSRSIETLKLEVDKLKEQNEKLNKAVIELQASMQELDPWMQRINGVLHQLFG